MRLVQEHGPEYHNVPWNQLLKQPIAEKMHDSSGIALLACKSK